jgi:hypothetical protein
VYYGTYTVDLKAETITHHYHSAFPVLAWDKKQAIFALKFEPSDIDAARIWLVCVFQVGPMPAFTLSARAPRDFDGYPCDMIEKLRLARCWRPLKVSLWR